MAPFHKQCLVGGCTAHPVYGYHPSKTAPMKWACSQHKHLLEKEAPKPADIPKKTGDDLFGPR